MGTGGKSLAWQKANPGYRGGVSGGNDYYNGVARRRREENQRHRHAARGNLEEVLYTTQRYTQYEPDPTYLARQEAAQAAFRREQAEQERIANEQWAREQPERERRAKEQEVARKRTEAMITAVKNGNLPTLQNDYKKDELKYVDSSGRSLLSFAVEAREPEMMKYLIKVTVSEEKVEFSTQVKMEFLNAVKSNNKEIVIKHLSKNRLCDLTIASQTAPLYVAAEKGYPEMVELLVAANAPINQVNNTHFWSDRDTALHRSASKGHEEVFKVLVKQGADMDIRTRYDLTARQIGNVKFGWKAMEIFRAQQKLTR